MVVLLLLILGGGIALTIWPLGGSPVAVNDPDENDPANDTQPGDEAEAADGAGPLFHVDPAPPPADEDNNTSDPAGGAGADGVTNDDARPADGTADDGSTTADAADGTPPTAPTVGGEVARIDPPLGVTPPVEGEAVGETADEPKLPLADRVAGYFMSAGQVMVGRDDKSTPWKRLAVRAPLKPGVMLRSLPTYRPHILLENDLQITFAGEGFARIGNPSDDVPRVEIPQGRVVIATLGKAGNQLLLRAGDRDVLLTMANADAALALDVRRFHLPGDDPEVEIAHVEVTATVSGGQVLWQQDGVEPVTLDAGQQIIMVDDAVPNLRPLESLPSWVKSNDISEIDRLASATLEPLLDDQRPMEIGLEERAEHSRVEVRSLAARCLASIDKFDRIIDTFDDDTLKSYWSEHYDRLQSALARGPSVAVQLREAIERRKGDDGRRLYRLLWGYSPAQLTAGAGKSLVEYLKHNSLDVRVLAINNLRRITGRTQAYHPHLAEVRRRTPQREWDQAAAANSIVYLNPPPVLPKRKPAP